MEIVKAFVEQGGQQIEAHLAVEATNHLKTDQPLDGIAWVSPTNNANKQEHLVECKSDVHFMTETWTK